MRGLHDFMKKILNQCSSFQLNCLILGTLTYVFYLVGHIPFSELCYFLRDSYGLELYRRVIQIIGLVLLIVFILWGIWRLWRTPQRLLKAATWLILMLTMGYYYVDLIKFDIEYIHFIQYCALVIVLFQAFKRRYLSAMILCIGLGLLDELYQAYHPDGPFNWRDALLNVLGVLWGGLVLWTLETHEDSTYDEQIPGVPQE